MTREVVTVPPHRSVVDAARLMVDMHTHHLVVQERHGIVGVLSSFDLLEHLAGRVETLERREAPEAIRAEVGDTIVVRAA